MKSWPEEDLVLYLYGEHPRAGEIERALAEDPALARRLERLRRDLAPFDAQPLPELPADYEERVWSRLRPRLAEPAPRRLAARLLGAAPWRLAALAATLVAALAGAWFAGRSAARHDIAAELAGALPSALSPEARERLLLASVSGHLESSALLLTDLANAPAGGTLGDEPAWAKSLLDSNRLYRQAAERAGQRRIVALLDELEPLLLELAHAPARGEVRDLQHQIEERDLLFKVRVLGTRLAAGGNARTPPARSL